MRTLYILRHAKAGWPQGVEDRDRPLEERGRREAQAVAEKMARDGMRPDFVLCSPSVRTRQTLKPFLDQWPELPVSYEEGLYLATTGSLYEQVKAIDDRHETAMLIGHNPGIHGLVQFLAGEGDKQALAQLAEGYKTACLSVINCKCKTWSAWPPAGGRLESLFSGKELA